MQTLLNDLAYYLEQNDIGVQASTLFIGGFAGDEDDQVALQLTGGVEPYKDIPVARPTVQITIRDKSYEAGIAKAYEIFNLLDQADDRLVLKAGGVDVMQVNALSEPNYLGADNSSRHLFTINFVFMLRRDE